MDSIRREARVLLVINKYEREIRTMERVQGAILDVDPTARVEISNLRSVARMREFEASVILTYPFTGVGLSLSFYVLKSQSNCAVVCFATEGVLDYGSQSLVEQLVGIDKYGPSLVDYYIFWGRWAAHTLGKALLEQKKLSSLERVKYFGHPQFEQYFDKQGESPPSLPGRLDAKVKAFVKDRTFLFVTGFQLADYSAEELAGARDMFDPQDANAKEELQKWIGAVGRMQQRRREWINMITECASQSPDVLLVVKSHPTEHAIFRSGKEDPYKIWDDCPNILYVPEPIHVADLLPHCSLFFHYGSTTALDSILSEVPSVYVMPKGIERNLFFAGTPEISLPSTIVVDVVDVPRLINQHLISPVKFELTPSMERALEMLLNIPRNRVYTPSRDIARFLLAVAHRDIQRISETNPFLVDAMRKCH